MAIRAAVEPGVVARLRAAESIAVLREGIAPNRRLLRAEPGLAIVCSLVP